MLGPAPGARLQLLSTCRLSYYLPILPLKFAHALRPVLAARPVYSPLVMRVLFQISGPQEEGQGGVFLIFSPGAGFGA